jgi:hypothetical protein
MTKNQKDEVPEVVSARAPSHADKAIMAFGTQLYIDSVSKLIDYGKTMITLVSGIFTVYFALLEFLGISALSPELFNALPNLWWAPVCFIFCIIVFVVGVVLPYPQVMSLQILNEVAETRKRLMWTKYIASLIGTAFFVYGLFLTLQISIILLKPTVSP